jgi:hypothetical protein
VNCFDYTSFLIDARLVFPAGVLIPGTPLYQQNLFAGAIILKDGERLAVLEIGRGKAVLAPIGHRKGPGFRGDEIVEIEEVGISTGERWLARCGRAVAIDIRGLMPIGKIDAATLLRLRLAAKRAAETRQAEGTPNLPVSMPELACGGRGRRVSMRDAG